MKFQFLTENFSRSENAPPFETRKIRHFEVERIFLENKKMVHHYRPHAGLGGKMVKPYPQDMNAPVREVSFLGGLLHGYRREPMAA